jgi:hypothetical protein
MRCSTMGRSFSRIGSTYPFLASAKGHGRVDGVILQACPAGEPVTATGNTDPAEKAALIETCPSPPRHFTAAV